MRDYELTFILQPTLEDEERSTLIEQIQAWIDNEGGQVVKVNHWGGA